MAVEERVVEEEVGGVVEEVCGVGGLVWERALGVEGDADGGGGFAGGDGAVGEGVEEVGDAIDEGVAEGLELLGRHGEGRDALSGGWLGHCGLLGILWNGTRDRGRAALEGNLGEGAC